MVEIFKALVILPQLRAKKGNESRKVHIQELHPSWEGMEDTYPPSLSYSIYSGGFQPFLNRFLMRGKICLSYMFDHRAANASEEDKN